VLDGDRALSSRTDLLVRSTGEGVDAKTGTDSAMHDRIKAMIGAGTGPTAVELTIAESPKPEGCCVIL
jgi:hypothetical protein